MFLFLLFFFEENIIIRTKNTEKSKENIRNILSVLKIILTVLPSIVTFYFNGLKSEFYYLFVDIKYK